MKYLLTRKAISEAFYKSLGDEQQIVLDSLTANQTSGPDFREEVAEHGLLIEPFSRFNGMGIVNSDQFFQNIRLIPMELTEDGNDLLLEYPHGLEIPPLAYLWGIFNECNQTLGTIYGSGYPDDEHYLESVYNGKDSEMGWDYDWSDLHYFINHMDTYLNLVLNYQP